MNAPWNANTVKISVTKHFAIKYLRKWNWNFHDLRDAFQDAYKIESAGSEKFEVYIEKGGFKKVIVVYYTAAEELVCISGSEGGKRI